MSVVPPHRVIYVATGERHLREAAASLRSLWRHQSGTPVTMYVDRRSRPRLREWGIPASHGDLLEVLDHPDPRYSWADKPTVLSLGDGEKDERILFLDSDTRVCGSIGEVFEILGRFELAAAHAPVRLDPRQPGTLGREVPTAFPELNTGVVAFRRTATVTQFLDRWRRMHLDALDDRPNLGDQATFRVALYDSPVRFTVLPPEYNCRFTFPTYVHGHVRILHGRGSDLESIEREVNGATGARVFVPGIGLLTASSAQSRPRGEGRGR